MARTGGSKHKHFTFESCVGLCVPAHHPSANSISLQFRVAVNMAEMAFIGMNAIAPFFRASTAITIANLYTYGQCVPHSAQRTQYLLDFTRLSQNRSAGQPHFGRYGDERKNKVVEDEENEDEEEERRWRRREGQSTEINGSWMCVCVLIK